MAEDSGQERTEQPTPRRKQQARKKGQVVTSRELNTMLMMLLSGGAVLFLGPGAAEKFSSLFRKTLSVDRAHIFDPTAMPELFKLAILDAFWILLPFFTIMMLASVAGPLLLGSVTFSTESLTFKWEKLDPIKGLKRVFAWRGVVELFKALAKFAVLGSVAVMYLHSQSSNYIGLGYEPVLQAMGHAAHLLIMGFLTIASALILIAVVDVPFQLWDHQRQLKMTFQEIKDENKDTEGNPDVRGRVRRIQREIAQRRMMADVPKADVIVTNPTHFAVALSYDPESNFGAPVVVAKGADVIALQIRRIANEHQVLIMEAPPLARALYHFTELKQEIPEGLYLAVAQVLAYVFQLKRQSKSRHKDSYKMNNLPIPDEMNFDES